MADGDSAGVDWGLLIGSLALVLGVFANYGNVRSTFLRLIADIRAFAWETRVRWAKWRVGRIRDDEEAAGYLKAKGISLTTEVLARMCGGHDGVPTVKGKVNRIIFAVVDERVSDVASSAYDYFTAASIRDKSEMDLQLNVLSFVVGNLYANLHAILRLPCALNMAISKRFDEHTVQVLLFPFAEDRATLHWNIYAGQVSATPMLRGQLTVRRKNEVFWEQVDFRIRER